MTRVLEAYRFFLAMLLGMLGMLGMWVSVGSPAAFCGARPPSDRDFAGDATSPAVCLVAVSRGTAQQRGRAEFSSCSTPCASACGQRCSSLAVTLDTDTTVHSLYGKQLGWGAQELQPEEPWQEQLPADLDLSGGDREFIAGQLRNGELPTDWW